MSATINQYQIQVGDQTVDVARWVPEGEPSGLPILIAPGWTATFPLIRHILLDLRQLNRPIYAVLHPRVKQLPDNEGEYDGTQILKADHILAVIKEYNLNKVDLLSHSSGSIEAVRVAELIPDKIRSLLLLNPAGLLHKPSLFKFYRRSLIKMVDDTWQSIVARNRNKEMYNYHYGQGRRYILFHIPKAFKELHGINRAKLHSAIEGLRAKGVYVAVIAGDSDVMYPLKELRHDAKSIVDHFKVTHGWHDAVLFHPEHYTKLIGDELRLVASHARSQK